MKDTRYGTTLDAAFIRLVSDDAKGFLDEAEAASLRHPDSWEDWMEALSALKRDTEAQLAKRKAELLEFQQDCLADGPDGKQEYFAEKSSYESWRAAAVRFKLSIEARIAELKKLKRNAQRAQDGVVNKSDLFRLLRWASNIIERTGEGRDWHAAYRDITESEGTTDGQS